MSHTVTGKVTLVEAIAPPVPTPSPEGETPPDPLQEVVDSYRAKMSGPKAGEKEGEEAKTWVHLHVTLDAPHAGELSVMCPEMEASGLVLDGRARVIFSSQ